MSIIKNSRLSIYITIWLHLCWLDRLFLKSLMYIVKLLSRKVHIIFLPKSVDFSEPPWYWIISFLIFANLVCERWYHFICTSCLLVNSFPLMFILSVCLFFFSCELMLAHFYICLLQEVSDIHIDFFHFHIIKRAFISYFFYFFATIFLSL